MINILDKKKFKRNGGQAMIISVLYFLFISFSIISGFVSPAVREVKTSSVNLNSKSAYFLAESGNEDAVYRTLTHKTIGSSEVITLNSNTVTTTITTPASAGQPFQFVSLGDLNSYQRKVSSEISYSLDVPFYYGVQVGLGGVDLQSSTIVGNVYANGPITGDTSSSITGTAISASGPALAVDQSNGGGVPTYDISFANANSTQDIAQSFILASSSPINKVQFYLKKVSSPSDLTVKIVNNDISAGPTKGLPGSTVYATATLSASSVTGSYAWVDAVFTTNPTLTAGTTYWVVVDSAISNAGRYYVSGANTGISYSNGSGFIGQFGVNWADIYVTGSDYFFKIYLGGISGRIAGSSGSQWNPLRIGTTSGTAQANTVNYVNSTGTIYCQNGTGNNLPCTFQTDPQYIDYPIPDANITSWKTEAEASGVIGSYNLPSGSATLGSTKINGNLTVGGGAVLTVSGTLWVTGNISLTGGSQIRLSSSYGKGDGVIVSDGTITIGGGSDATGSGDPDSYIMLLTTSSSASAVTVSGGSGAVILYAHNGTVNVSGGAALQEVTANRLLVSGNSTVTYNSGLQNISFSSGPTATVVSPNLGSWKEIQ